MADKPMINLEAYQKYLAWINARKTFKSSELLPRRGIFDTEEKAREYGLIRQLLQLLVRREILRLVGKKGDKNAYYRRLCVAVLSDNYSPKKTKIKKALKKETRELPNKNKYLAYIAWINDHEEFWLKNLREAFGFYRISTSEDLRPQSAMRHCLAMLRKKNVIEDISGTGAWKTKYKRTRIITIEDLHG